MTTININMLSKITYIISCPIVIHILSHILREQLSTTFERFLLFRLFIDSSKATGLSQRSQFNLIFSLVPRLFEHSEFSPLPHRFNSISHGFVTALCGFPAVSLSITGILKIVDTPFYNFSLLPHCYDQTNTVKISNNA